MLIVEFVDLVMTVQPAPSWRGNNKLFLDLVLFFFFTSD